MHLSCVNKLLENFRRDITVEDVDALSSWEVAPAVAEWEAPMLELASSERIMRSDNCRSI